MRTRTLASLALVMGAIAQQASGAAAQRGTEDAPTVTRTEVPSGEPRYLGALRSELEALGIDDATCEAVDAQRATCTTTQRGANSRRDLVVRIAYSDRTDTVYLYVPQYLRVPQGSPNADVVLRRLMELNAQTLLGKFEWDPTRGEVRVSMVLSTDSNFDRRAFRSAFRSLLQLADRHLVELERLQAPAP